MAAAAEQYPDAAVRGDSAETVICAEDAAYPTGMFENVRQMETGSTQVFKFESMIYLIQKTDMSKAKDIYFERYKKTCMIRIKQEETEKMINALAQSYKIVYNI